MTAKFRFAIVVLLIASAIAAFAFPGKKKYEPEGFSFSDYIEKNESLRAEEKPSIDSTLAISVEMSGKPSGKLVPDEVFKGAYLDEFKNGAVVYFRKRNVFSAVDSENGDIALKLNIVGYQGGEGNKNRMSVTLNLKLMHAKSGNTMLAGSAESFLDDCPKDPKNPVIFSLGGKDIVIQEGSLRMAEIGYHVFEIVDSQILDAQKSINKKIESMGG